MIASVVTANVAAPLYMRVGENLTAPRPPAALPHAACSAPRLANKPANQETRKPVAVDTRYPGGRPAAGDEKHRLTWRNHRRP